MVSRIAQVTLDVDDVEELASFWSAAPGYRVERGEDGTVHLAPERDGTVAPTIWLQPHAAQKTSKNRCHLDLVAPDARQEVRRLLELGASRAHVGQTGEEPFEVLADPEGNEFCVLDHWRGS